MVISIEESLEKEIMGRSLFNNEIIILERIFSATIDEKAFFLPSIPFIDYLFDNYEALFSKRAINYLRWLKSDYFTTHGTVTSIGGPLIYLAEETKIVKEGIMNVFYMTFNDFPDNIIPYMYCENVVDAEAYITLTQFIFCRNKKNIFVSLRGYGGCNPSELQNLVHDKCVFFAIADSDKSFESDSKGPTAKCVQDELDNSYCANYYILSVREKENLIPASYYESIDIERDKLLELVTNSNEDVRDFFDLKDGIKKKKYDKFYTTSAQWTKINRNIIERMRAEGYFHIAVAEDDKCIFGIGNNALTNSVNTILQSNRPTFLSLLTKRSKTDFKNIDSYILKYGYKFSGRLS